MRVRLIAGAVAVGSIFLVTACGSGSESPDSDSGSSDSDSGSSAEDEGATIEMWVRSTTSGESQTLVDAWNASNDQQIALTVIPQENYLQRVSTAAGSGQLPCLMASDIVYMPNFIENGLFADISEQVGGLDYADQLAPGIMDLTTDGDAVYGVPHVVALSAIFQNELLLEQAGIDPTEALSSLSDFADKVAQVGTLGEDVIPLYFAGNAGNSIAFTHFPSIWASGAEVISEDGTESLLDSDESIGVFQVYNDLAKAGHLPMSAASETGATRNEVFAQGNVAYMLASNATVKAVEGVENVRLGVQGIPGLDGSIATFLGGDAIGLTATCEEVDGAWGFLDFTLSEETQVGVYAENRMMLVRSDLADNETTAQDPIALKLNSFIQYGRTPYSLNFGQTFNDPNGPALSALRQAIFESDDVAATLREYNPQISASLAG